MQSGIYRCRLFFHSQATAHLQSSILRTSFYDTLVERHPGVGSRYALRSLDLPHHPDHILESKLPLGPNLNIEIDRRVSFVHAG
jgi:hypothetical protein